MFYIAPNTIVPPDQTEHHSLPLSPIFFLLVDCVSISPPLLLQIHPLQFPKEAQGGGENFEPIPFIFIKLHLY